MSAADVHDVLDVVLFSAGGWRVGFEAQRVSGARPAAAESISEIEPLLGLPGGANRGGTPQWLSLKQADQEREILVAGPVELTALPVAAIHPLPPLLAARTGLHGLRALALQAGTNEMTLLFDAPDSVSAVPTFSTA